MKLRIQQFIEDKLSNAEYKLDDSVGEWCGWIKGFPGIYAQGKSIEVVRQELAEMTEEYILLNIFERRKVKGLKFEHELQYA